MPYGVLWFTNTWMFLWTVCVACHVNEACKPQSSFQYELSEQRFILSAGLPNWARLISDWFSRLQCQDTFWTGQAPTVVLDIAN